MEVRAPDIIYFTGIIELRIATNDAVAILGDER